ncbi:cadherin-like protein 26 [Lampris incognitus]|uniref:cadherin-like protein 26 n=1 Tax=Lampris incognitus TaxID=2546036 RepID=UPI0024B54F8D|nr:cadherin-like protein 26 [Lampris incognitus]
MTSRERNCGTYKECPEDIIGTIGESLLDLFGTSQGCLEDFPAYAVFSVHCSEPQSRQKRGWIIDSFTIEEGHPGPFPYMLGKISIERKYRTYFDLYGEGVDEEPKGVLSIEKDSGIVFIHKAMDYEDKEMLKLRFEARKMDLSLDTKLGFEIRILDINDNPPRFQRDIYEISIKESEAQGSHLVTVLANDRDQAGSANSTFHYDIVSVSPNPPNAEFFIDDSGAISFKGCLDYEVGEKYTVLVEAKDDGDVVSLSSSTSVFIHIGDGNNHPPAISSQTGAGKVKEGDTGLSPLRLHVTDGDGPNSPAWKVKYTIQNNDGGHFKVFTDPDTNDGILTVVKTLDFEGAAERELLISVENEVPYFSCKVKERTSSGLWIVDTGTVVSGMPKPSTVKVVIRVEDRNDPPVFTVAVKEAFVEENAEVGTLVEKVTAKDPDSFQPRDFVYMIGHDPDGWVKVDPHTGQVTTAKILDRESPYMVNNIYTVILHAVDGDEPPMTGSSTLLIHVKDQNDNAPQLAVNHLHVCVSDDPTTSNITAIDLDDEPYGGPVRFEMLGDVTGKWRLSPSYGHVVNLVKQPSMYAGTHTVELKVSNIQGHFAIHNLSVTACDCSVMPNCWESRATVTNIGYEAIVVAFASLFLLLCKSESQEFSPLQTDLTAGETLLSSNTEAPGRDCQVMDRSTMDTGVHKENSNYYVASKALLSLLHQRLLSLCTTEDLDDDQPHLYAEEGHFDTLSELEPISLPDDCLDLTMLEDLGSKFSQLASICKPHVEH